jgi:AcrR family transcriptional regulator
MKLSYRPPKQRRSQQTMDRILHATEQLLQDHEFDALSVHEIVRAARTSVGAFYTRFRDKRSLLAGLYERYDAALGDWVEQWREMQGAAPVDLQGAAEWVSRGLCDLFRSRRHLLRALALYVRTHPEDLQDSTRVRRASQLQFLADELLRHQREFRHPEPERAAEAAVFAAASVSRERILFPEGAHASSMSQTDAQLLQDTTLMMLGILCPASCFDFSSL